MTERFVTSDLHFFHRNIIKYTNRPWTYEEQTEELIERWNSRVGLLDDVYHLGDFAFLKHGEVTRLVEIIKQLNGNIHFIMGNHDDRSMFHTARDMEGMRHVAWVKDYYELRDGRNKVAMMHYPLTIWNRSHHGAWMLHGHTHGSFQGAGKIMDCGIDNHPEHQVFAWDEIKQFMDQREIAVFDHHNGERA